MATTTPPTGQRSAPTAGQPGIMSWSQAAQAAERSPEWRWPRANHTVASMLPEAKVWALYSATVMPLVDEYDWWIDPNGCQADSVDRLCEDLGLPVGDKLGPDPDLPELTRLAGRFDWIEHLRTASEFLAFGHYYFETVNEYVGGLYRLRKLLPIAPESIAEIDVDQRDGGLVGIRQQGTTLSMMGGTMFAGQPPLIDVGRIVGYVWWPSAQARWIGRSMLRPLYRNYLSKDILLRVDVVNHKRAGGVPYIVTDATFQGATLDDLARLAQEFTVEADGGAALPPGADLRLAGIKQGSGQGPIDSARYHDEQMSELWGQMVKSLASKTQGSRALGDTLQDSEALFRRSVANVMRSTAQTHLIGKWWGWNVDPEARQLPVLRFRPPGIETADAGAGVPAPENPPVVPAGGAPPTDPPVAATGLPSPRPAGPGVLRPDRRVWAAAGPPVREVRRQLYEHEIAAAVDFQALDVSFAHAADALDVLFLQSILPEHMAAIGDAITYTKSGTARKVVRASDMAKITAPVVGREGVTQLLADVALEGARLAAAELAAQGLEVSEPTAEAAAALISDHAQAVVQQLADGVSIAASRKAVQLSGGLGAVEVARGVADYVGALKHQWERDQLAGAVQQAQNAGRMHVYAEAGGTTVVDVYASELLDASTCGPCASVDGKQFVSLEEARTFYPSGGYVACQGGPRCRGTVVATLSTETQVGWGSG